MQGPHGPDPAPGGTPGHGGGGSNVPGGSDLMSPAAARPDAPGGRRPSFGEPPGSRPTETGGGFGSPGPSGPRGPGGFGGGPGGGGFRGGGRR